MHQIVLLSGPPHAGRSAVARALCERFDRMLHVDVDALRSWVRAGYRHPWARDEQAREQRLLAIRNASAIARECSALRYACVIDDAALAGRSGPALSQMHQVLRDGQSAGYVLYMLHRQVRLLILAKELQRKGVRPQEMGKRLGIRGYPLQKTLEQAPRFTRERLAAAHRLLAEADERVKSGGARDEVALDLLLSDLAGLARMR